MEIILNSAACLINVSVKNTCSYGESLDSSCEQIMSPTPEESQNHWDPVQKQWVSPKLKMLGALRDQTVKRYSLICKAQRRLY